MKRPALVRYRFARKGERVNCALFHEPDKVAVGVLWTWGNVSFFLLVGAVRLSWFVPHEEPHLGPQAQGGPVRGMRKADTGKTPGRTPEVSPVL